MKDSEKFVKYLVRLFGIKDGVEFEELLQYHKCTESDWTQFAPPEKGSQDDWEKIKADPNRGMYCLDLMQEPGSASEGDNQERNLTVFGNEKNGNYQRIEVVLVPCNYLHSNFETVSQNCEPNLNAQIKYLGPLELIIYHTQVNFISESMAKKRLRFSLSF